MHIPMSVSRQAPTGWTAAPHTAGWRHLAGPVCVVVTALGWGLNWPATKLLLTACPPLSARGISGAAACMILFLAAAARGESLAVRRADRGWLVLGALLNVSVWMGGTTAAMRWLPAGQAATLAYTMPVWVCLLAWPVLRERPSVRQAAAIALGLAGILVLLGLSSLGFRRDDAPGIALALGAAALFALGTVTGKARPVALGPLGLTAWQVGLGSIPLLLAGLTLESPDIAALPPFGWAALAYTAVVSMGLCYVTWFVARSLLPAPAAAMGTLLTPVIGVLASALALGEPLGLRQGGALLLVAAGIVLASAPSAAPLATRPAGGATKAASRRA